MPTDTSGRRTRAARPRRLVRYAALTALLGTGMTGILIPVPASAATATTAAVPAHARGATDPSALEQTIALLILTALSFLLWWGWQVLRRHRHSLTRPPSLSFRGRRDATPPPAAEHPTVELPLTVEELTAEPPPAAGEPTVDEDVVTGPSLDDYPPTTAASARDLPDAEPASASGDVLRTVVVSEYGAVAVRLVGARTPSEPAGHGWFHGMPPREASPTLVSLGANEAGTLHVDLALAPDVVTVTGSPEARQQQASSLVRQLVRAGVPVTAVGSPFGASDPPGCPRVATVEDAIDDTAGSNDELRVLFYAPPGGPDADGDDADLAAVRRALSVRPRLVPVLVGDVRPGRWSIDVQVLGAPDTGTPIQAVPASSNGTATGSRRRV